MKRIRITLPDHQTDAVRWICRWRGTSRSRVIQQALDFYLASQQVAEEADRVYEAGYRATPEDPGEAEAYAKMAAEILAPEEWA